MKEKYTRGMKLYYRFEYLIFVLTLTNKHTQKDTYMQTSAFSQTFHCTTFKFPRFSSKIKKLESIYDIHHITSHYDV